MRFRWNLCATAVGVLAASASTRARAGTVFISTAAGAAEPPVAAHVPYGSAPPGHDAVELVSPSAYRLDIELGSVGAAPASSRPSSDAPADPLPGSELYFNVRIPDFANGELRGQLQPLGGTTDDAGNGTAIPLPHALLPGLAGLGATVRAVRRRRSRISL